MTFAGSKSVKMAWDSVDVDIAWLLSADMFVNETCSLFGLIVPNEVRGMSKSATLWALDMCEAVGTGTGNPPS